MYDPTIRYVRPGGNDLSGGTTPTTPWASLSNATRFAADCQGPMVIDVTGMDIAGSDILALGARDLGPLNFDLDPGAAVPDNFFSRRFRQIRSSVQVVQEIHQTGQSFDPVDKFWTLTVAETLTPSALIGLRVIGAQAGVYGVVRENTATTVEVTNINAASAGGLVPGAGGLLWLCKPGATITVGDPSDPFAQALYLQALCDWSLHGLALKSHGKSTALCIYGSMPVDLRLCDIEGIQIAGQAPVTLDGCYVTKTFIHDSGAVIGQQSLFRGTDFVCHGASGITQFFGCAFDANPSGFGGGGGPSAAYSYRVENCGARWNAGGAFYVPGGRTSLKNVVCEGNGATDITVVDNGHLTTQNVVGTIAYV